MGARVLALDISNERLELAKHFGADELINSNEHEPVSAIKDLTHGEGAHKTLEASSAPSARKAAVQSVRSWGIACFVGERGEVALDVSPDLLRRQVTLVGSWTFSTQGQSECAEFVAENNIDVEKLFTDKWSLDDAEEAYEKFDKQNSGKGVIIPA
jgi:threonine dehydrogenase-like Zn-dependent dehydrogenase